LTGNQPKELKNMADADFLPGPDEAFDTWLANFAAKCEIYETELGLDTGSLTQITQAYTTFNNSLTTVAQLKETLKGEVGDKDDNRKASTATVRAFAKQFKAIPGISSNILGSLGITANNPATPVVPVTGLTVNGCDDGVNTLKWKRSTNSQGTMFIIESSLTGTGGWELVDVVTKTSYAHEDQIPGQRQFYRIKSKRANVTSAATPAVVVYATGGEGGLSIAA
jgi:hypothetical protein